MPDTPNSSAEGIRGQRVRKGKGHESISRDAIQDHRLSFKSTGILTFLLSLPDNWRTNADRLSKAKNSRHKVKEGRESIQNGLQELEDTGYLVRRKFQDEHGRWGWDWRYSDDPADLGGSDVSAGQTGNGSPVTVSPVTVSPVVLEVSDVEVLDVENLKPSAPANADPGGQAPSASKAGCGAPVTDLFGGQPAAPAKRKRAAKATDPDAEAREQNARDVVKAWVDAYRTTGTEPPGYRCGQVGKEAKALLLAGNTVERLIESATAAGRQGWWSLERQLTAAARLTSQSNVKRGRFGVSATELPADDWRRWVQE